MITSELSDTDYETEIEGLKTIMNEVFEESAKLDIKSVVSQHLFEETLTLMPSQVASWREILELVGAHSESKGLALKLKPRFFPLIIAPSGSGKSSIVRHIARSVGFNYLRTTPGNWNIHGSRGDMPTLEVIKNALETKGSLILHVDEIDKICSTADSPWFASVVQEMFSVLDLQLPPLGSSIYSKDAADKLKDHTFIVGSGTWQGVWDKLENRKVGFSRDHSINRLESIREDLEKSPIIPIELRRRFRQKLVLIDYPNASELANAAEQMGLTQLAKQTGHVLDFSAGEISRKAARWLEEEAAEAILKIFRQKKSIQRSPRLEKS